LDNYQEPLSSIKRGLIEFGATASHLL